MIGELRLVHPWALALLALLPSLVWLSLWLARRQTGTFSFSRAHLLACLSSRGLAARLRYAPLALRIGALALGLVALARPQLLDPEEVLVEGFDIALALDMSGSMQSVDQQEQEILLLQSRRQEPPSRFDIARGVLQRFVESRVSDRIGLVVFGEHAYTQFPLTLDYSTMLQILDRLELGDISGDSTVIGNALGKSLNFLRESEAKTKLVILITDGENNAGNIAPMQAATFADTLGVKVFTILVGSNDLARVPTARDFFTGRVVYKKVRHATDPELLQKMAERTGGQFYRAEDRQALEHTFADILAKFEKSRIRDLGNVEHTELFPWLLVAALGLLLLEAGLGLTVLRKFP
ncbi:MAG: VWA domain-containing protein [Deltaproteobacteria bacterium]|nr:VWA domain-containing protein [Deltaproteobacteria bacterium]